MNNPERTKGERVCRPWITFAKLGRNKVRRSEATEYLCASMLNKFFKKFFPDIGIDLGSANTLVYVRDRGIVINESSVVAVNTRTDEILAVGEEAKKMIGKTPVYISVSKPLAQGIITDFEVAEKMLKYFIERVHQGRFIPLPRPRVVIGIPLDTTEVERKAVEDVVIQAGGRKAFLIEEPMAAAIGARLPIQEPVGTMIVDIGGGTTEIAVISLGGIVTWKRLSVAGDTLNQDIIYYVRVNFNLLLGESTAEEIKIKIGSAWSSNEIKETKIRGRDLISGLPKEILVNDAQIREAMNKSIKTILEAIRNTLETTPPELVADIYERGITLTGGGALLQNLDKLISKEIQIPVRVTDDPLTAVVRGAGIVLEDLERLKDVLLLPTVHPFR